MKAEVRELLDEIDEMLIGPHGIEIVDILSAIRGPDSDDLLSSIKRISTNVVRREAFPLAFKKSLISTKRWDVEDTPLEFGDVFSLSDNSHFINHIQLARSVLEAEE